MVRGYGNRSAGGGGGRGGGRGRGTGGSRGLGPEGDCICPKCGAVVAHQRGVPCNSMKCPSCGTTLTRQN